MIGLIQTESIIRLNVITKHSNQKEEIVYDKGDKNIQWGKKVISINVVGKPDSYMKKKMKLDPFLNAIYKNELKMD